MEEKENVRLLKQQLALFVEREKALMKQLLDQSNLLSHQSIQLQSQSIQIQDQSIHIKELTEVSQVKKRQLV